MLAPLFPWWLSSIGSGFVRIVYWAFALLSNGSLELTLLSVASCLPPTCPSAWTTTVLFRFRQLLGGLRPSQREPVRAAEGPAREAARQRDPLVTEGQRLHLWSPEEGQQRRGQQTQVGSLLNKGNIEGWTKSPSCYTVQSCAGWLFRCLKTSKDNYLFSYDLLRYAAVIKLMLQID